MLPHSRPNPDDMLCHVKALFGDQTDGLIELTWCNPDEHWHAQLFRLDQFEDLVERAVELNSAEGTNAYIGAALRHPDTAPFGRTGDADFFAATTPWADLDDAEAMAKARELCGSTPCNFAVLTGRHPHPRGHLYFRTEEAITDADAVRRQNKGIAIRLGGDPSVVNPGRILRLAGSVVWPTKPGRVVELTEFMTFDDGRPNVYLEDEIARQFPLKSESENHPRPDLEASVDPMVLLNSIGPGNVHDNLLRFTGHCVGAGMSDWAIQALAAPYLDRGREPRTPNDLQKMIDGARRNLGKPDPGVTEASSSNKHKAEPGSTVLFPDVEPWPDPVDGSKLVEDLIRTIERYVALPDHAAVAVALWIIHAHASDAWSISPILALESPQKRCGKTTLLTVIQRLVPRPLASANITAAALFRTTERYRPTLLIDEADTFLRNSDELRGVLNSGHCRESAVTIRTVGDAHEPRAFKTWAPKAIALIGTLPPTLEDRSIVIGMRRRSSDEVVERLRLDKRQEFVDLAQRCARWALDSIDGLSQAEPDISSNLHDRAADNWRPLLAIADCANGHWPMSARDAALSLSSASVDDDSIGVLLLGDIRTVFDQEGADRLSSAKIVELLVEMDDRPWSEYRKDKPITTNQLARALKPFGIHPGTIRLDDGKTPKGYKLEAFTDAFERYLLSQPATTPQTAVTNDFRQIQTATSSDDVAVQKPLKTAVTNVCGGVAVGEGGSGEKAESSEWETEF